jgi:insertion element IS1 protein InsB
LDRNTGRVVVWVTGDRDATTFRKLYDKVKHLTECIFYTDNWSAFVQVLPASRHIIGKAGTVAIERDNSNTRHHLGRMSRRTKIVSKSEKVVYDSIKLWNHIRSPEVFKKYMEVFLSIFK